MKRIMRYKPVRQGFSFRVNFLFFYLLPVLLWSGVIFYFSNQPGLKTGSGVSGIIFRKLAHLTEFGILALLSWRLFLNYSKNYTRLNSCLKEKVGGQDSKKEAITKIKFGNKSFKQILIQSIFLALFFSFCFAVSDEIHQTFVFNRSGNFIDIIVDLVGIAVVLQLIWLVYTKKILRNLFFIFSYLAVFMIVVFYLTREILKDLMI